MFIEISAYEMKNLHYANENFPTDWTFAGSNDGVNWIIIDTQNGHDTWGNREIKKFELTTGKKTNLFLFF